ncbi:hypothetical protein R3W88_029578 [Solanum pinnatisectum]|uniref:Uncharacterized protein n=1 Tax=Solanum pinnatisectum TaxID=50273 RepID=A0AAV9K5S3_9SOLN|nr:hypothetical protein R3W88_029578 [Solanum pinnatisectum]
MDDTAFVSILFWNKETIQLLGRPQNFYPTKLGDSMKKKFLFKILIKDSNINKNDNVYKITPIKTTVSECGSSFTEDVIDLAAKISIKSRKTVEKSIRYNSHQTHDETEDVDILATYEIESGKIYNEGEKSNHFRENIRIYNSITNVKLRLIGKRLLDGRRYNLPSVLVVGDFEPTNTDSNIIIKSQT